VAVLEPLRDRRVVGIVAPRAKAALVSAIRQGLPGSQVRGGDYERLPEQAAPDQDR
jgi:hypothetical protein